jgi:hypothetical protein
MHEARSEYAQLMTVTFLMLTGQASGRSMRGSGGAPFRRGHPRGLRPPRSMSRPRCRGGRDERAGAGSHPLDHGRDASPPAMHIAIKAAPFPVRSSSSRPCRKTPDGEGRSLVRKRTAPSPARGGVIVDTREHREGSRLPLRVRGASGVNWRLRSHRRPRGQWPPR